jgi:hypothetical protein
MKQHSFGAHQNTKVEPVWFLEFRRFTTAWSELRLSVEDLILLQDVIKRDPNANPVITGTGGLRKMRFASPRVGNKGKRGSLRICYAYFPRFSGIILISAYSKADMDDLTPAAKKSIKLFLKDLENELEYKLGNEP